MGPRHCGKGVSFFLFFSFSVEGRTWGAGGSVLYVRDFYGVIGEAMDRAGDERSKRRMTSGTVKMFSVLHSHRDREDRWT